MEQLKRVGFYLYPTPSGASSTKRPVSALSTSTADSERTAIRKDALRLYRRSELPSIYDASALGTGLDCVDGPPVGGGKEEEADGVDWEGEGDRKNPKNWPVWKKSVNVGCIWLMCVISPFTSSVIAPAIADLMVDFGSQDPYLSAFVLSVYVLGYAVGPLLVSPLSEVYGRVPLYHVCNVLYTVCTASCGRTHNLQTLAIFRFFAGVGGSSVFALAPSSLADIVTKNRGAVLALIAIGYNLGPAVSPTVGSYVNAAWGWRWIFYLTGIMGASASLLSAICLSEAYEPVLLRRKAARLRKQTGNPSLRSRLDVDSRRGRLVALRKAMAMPFRMLFFSPSILLISLITAIGYGYVYILYTTLPTTFLVTYEWEQKKIGLSYLGTAVGNLVGMAAGGAISDAIVKRRAAKGDMKPENRLLPMIFFWPLVSIGLFVYAWTAQHAVHWVAPLIGTAVFGAGAMSTIFFTGTYIVDAYPVHSASGMAASAVLRSLFGGLAPLFSHKLYQKFDVGWTFSMLAFIALAFALVPWVFYKYGERWRKRERLDVGRAVDTEAIEIQSRRKAGSLGRWQQRRK